MYADFFAVYLVLPAGRCFKTEFRWWNLRAALSDCRWYSHNIVFSHDRTSLCSDFWQIAKKTTYMPRMLGRGCCLRKFNHFGGRISTFFSYSDDILLNVIIKLFILQNLLISSACSFVERYFKPCSIPSEYRMKQRTLSLGWNEIDTFIVFSAWLFLSSQWFSPTGLYGFFFSAEPTLAFGFIDDCFFIILLTRKMIYFLFFAADIAFNETLDNDGTLWIDCFCWINFWSGCCWWNNFCRSRFCCCHKCSQEDQ